MSDMVINIDAGSSQPSRRSEHGSVKHQRFMKKRKYLERKGYLKQKQLPPNHSYGNQNRNFPSETHSWGQGKKREHQEETWNHYNGTKKPRNEQSFVNGFHQKVASSTSTRAPQLGNTLQPPTLTVHVGSGPHDSRVATYTPKGGSSNTHCSSEFHVAKGTDVNKLPQNLSEMHKVNLLSEFESGLPSVSPKQTYKMVAIDCEMVGTGPNGRNSALARCSVVNYHGDVVYDSYIQPCSPVTDYRTRWSGIRREHLVKATPFKLAQKEILKILSSKIVIGHAIQNDFKALNYFHPKELTRDTSKIPLLNRKAGFHEKEPASLKRLAKQLLHKDIQTGKSGHSSVEDAKTTMELYRIVEAEWERELAHGQQ
ncbi:interferon-stimulated 20 kDa exonuclease-like 2 [Discoglossus pictus]